MFQQIGCNDAVLLTSLLYCIYDVSVSWDGFVGCSKPIHRWLFTSIFSLILFRVAHLLCDYAASVVINGSVGVDGIFEFMQDLRPKGTSRRVLLALSWLIAVPILAMWTIVGTSWFRQVMNETPKCIPDDTYVWFLGLFLAICYGWLAILAALAVRALVLERRVRFAENTLRTILNDDMLRRWGVDAHISNHRALEAGAPVVGAGLKPEEIKALPREASIRSQPWLETECECSICLNDMLPSDSVRRLPCGHAFHCSCIDLWLLRCADCPLCKRTVTVGATSTGEWV